VGRVIVEPGGDQRSTERGDAGGSGVRRRARRPGAGHPAPGRRAGADLDVHRRCLESQRTDLEPSVPIHLGFDPQARTLLLVQSASATHPQSTTWTYAGSAWQQARTATAPEVVGGLVSDPATKTLYAFAGQVGSQDWNQLWSWRNSAWGQ
jgi:hypothetical protein